jgi:hypothetical protein
MIEYSYSAYTNGKMSLSTRSNLVAARVTFFTQIGQFPPSLNRPAFIDVYLL